MTPRAVTTCARRRLSRHRALRPPREKRPRRPYATHSRRRRGVAAARGRRRHRSARAPATTAGQDGAAVEGRRLAKKPHEASRRRRSVYVLFFLVPARFFVDAARTLARLASAPTYSYGVRLRAAAHGPIRASSGARNRRAWRHVRWRLPKVHLILRGLVILADARATGTVRHCSGFVALKLIRPRA